MAEPEAPPSINDGVPDSRDAWPQDVLDAAEKFAIGDVVRHPPLFYFADPRYAIWGATQLLSADSTGPELVDASANAPAYGVITSQSCDVAEEKFPRPRKPWIQIAPVYNLGSVLNSGEKRQLVRDRGPLHYYYLPALSTQADQFWVADLRIEMPVEKSWLAGKVPILGMTNSQQRRAFATRLGVLRVRPAWAEVVIECVQNALVVMLQDLQKTGPDAFVEVSNTISEVGARTDDALNPSTIQLLALCDLAPTDAVSDWWAAVNSSLRAGLRERSITCQQEKMLTLEECSVATYREFYPVPLQKYSPM